MNDKPLATAKPPKPINPKHKLFAEYLSADPDHKLGVAYEKAYPKSSKHASETSGHDLMKRPEVRQEYERLLAVRHKMIVEGLDLPNEWFVKWWKGVGEEARAAGDFGAANKAAEHLAKFLAKFPEKAVKHKHENSDGSPVKTIQVITIVPVVRND